MIILIIVVACFVSFIAGMRFATHFLIKMHENGNDKDKQWLKTVFKDKTEVKSNQSFQDRVNERMGSK